MEEKKIEITKQQLNDAVVYLFTDGELKSLILNNPTLLLLGPIIVIELWKILNGEKEENKDGGQEG